MIFYMNCDDKYNRIIENAKIRKKLNELGNCAIPGPTGPAGAGIKILWTYDTMDELTKFHPEGENGDCYIVQQKSLVFWDDTEEKWK